MADRHPERLEETARRDLSHMCQAGSTGDHQKHPHFHLNLVFKPRGDRLIRGVAVDIDSCS